MVDCKWIFHTKFKVDGSLDKYKAHLVAKGFQKTPGIDFFETFNPVIKPSTIRIIFTIAVTKGWNIQQVNINNVFLNGDLQEVVYMHQPKALKILLVLLMYATSEKPSMDLNLPLEPGPALWRGGPKAAF